METLGDYKQKHHAKYLERENERERARQEEQRRQNELKQMMQENLTQLSNTISVSQIISIIDTLALVFDELKDKSMLMDIGLNILSIINDNRHIMINMHNSDDMTHGESLKVKMQSLLAQCGIDGETLDFEVAMDCSRDEDIARQLEMGLIADDTSQIMTPVAVPPLPVRRRGRPRRNTNV